MAHINLPVSFLLVLTLWMAAASRHPGSVKGEGAGTGAGAGGGPLHPLWECEGQAEKLIAHCGLFIKKWPEVHIPPTFTCCLAVQRMDMKCVCAHIPPEMEKFYSCEKIVYVAQCCQNPLPPCSKCGDYTVPKA